MCNRHIGLPIAAGAKLNLVTGHDSTWLQVAAASTRERGILECLSFNKSDLQALSSMSFYNKGSIN
jgi:hypothetical protein